MLLCKYLTILYYLNLHFRIVFTTFCVMLKKQTIHFVQNAIGFFV